MPAPKQPPPRKKKIKVEPVDMPKRSTRTRKKPNRYDSESADLSTRKTSDVIIQNPQIPTIDMTEGSDKETENTPPETVDKQKEEVEPPRLKRTRTQNKQKTDPPKSKKEETEQNEPDESNKSGQTEYGDALSNLETSPLSNHNALSNGLEPANNPNGTFIRKSPRQVLNSTVVIEKPTVPQKSDPKLNETFQKTPPVKKKNNKEIFSPYDKVCIPFVFIWHIFTCEDSLRVIQICRSLQDQS